MPIPSPFHPRTSELNTAMRWKDWAGYHAVCSYDTYHEREYFAFRHAAGLIDVTPLFKYEIRGPDAAAFLSRVMVRTIAQLHVGQVSYCCWFDPPGQVPVDGPLWPFHATRRRVTSAHPLVTRSGFSRPKARCSSPSSLARLDTGSLRRPANTGVIPRATASRAISSPVYPYAP